MSCRGKLLPFYITMTTIDKPVQELWDWYIDRQVGNDHPTIKMKLSRFNGRICLFDFRKKVVFSWKYSLIGNFLKLRSKNYFRIFCEIEDNQVERYMKPNRSEWVSQVRVCTLRKIYVSILRRSKAFWNVFLVFFYAHFFFYLNYTGYIDGTVIFKIRPVRMFTQDFTFGKRMKTNWSIVPKTTKVWIGEK